MMLIVLLQVTIGLLKNDYNFINDRNNYIITINRIRINTMDYGFKSYTGQLLTNPQVDHYNKLTAIIDARISEKSGVCGIERLKDTRHKFFVKCSDKRFN